MKIALVGFGTVGQGLAEIMRDKAAELRQQQGFEAQIVAVATRSRGMLYCADGLDITALLKAIEGGNLSHYPDQPNLHRSWDARRVARDSNADVLVEASPSNLETGQPALDVCQVALTYGKHVVLANKGPVAVAYDELQALAQQQCKALLFEATVMAGTPSLRLGLEALAGCRILEARGILNGTTNYILTQMEEEKSYAQALAQAQQLGYAEADPTADVDGWDAAAKAIIVAAALFHKKLTFAEMDVKGISGITEDDVASAHAAGERWKLIARVTPEGGSVQPMRISANHPLAGVSGATNAITYVTDLLGEVTLVGAGAGRQQTGFGLLSDLLAIGRMYR